MISILFIGLGLILVFMTVIWSVSLVIKDSSIVDIFWGVSFVFLNTIYFYLTEGYILRKILILSIVAIGGSDYRFIFIYGTVAKEKIFAIRFGAKGTGRIGGGSAISRYFYCKASSFG